MAFPEIPEQFAGRQGQGADPLHLLTLKPEVVAGPAIAAGKGVQYLEVTRHGRGNLSVFIQGDFS
jgi:hypothetical protein